MLAEEHSIVQGRTWQFLGTGWWILHIIGIIGLFYSGAWYAVR